MTVSLTSVDPATIPETGGHLLTITGTFELNHRYNVHVGQTKTTGDAICYSGKPDQGSVVYPESTTTLKAYSPVLEPTSVNHLYVVDLDDSTNDSLDSVITIAFRQFFSTVHGLRKLLPSFYKTGPRDIGKEPQ